MVSIRFAALGAFCLVLAASASVYAGGALAAAPLNTAAFKDPEAVLPDPQIRQGVLPNGMRYAVMKNAVPARSVSFRLYMNVGSYDETEGERGVAHFLEHMAFNGTRHIGEGKLDTLFGQAGVAFGRDQNAQTTYFGTLYMLDVPQVDDARLDLAFEWLRDVGDGLKLDPAAVNRERGVIHAEDDRSKGPERAWSEKLTGFMASELRTTIRDPIGTSASIDGLDAAKLRHFYERWYRPDDATLVVVGDLPVDVLEKRVIASFGSWKAHGPMPRRERVTSPRLNRGFDILTVAEPRLASSVNVCWIGKFDRDPPDNVARARVQLRRRLWRDVLNERLRGLAANDDPPFVAAEASNREADREALYSCVDLLPVKDDWRRGLDAAMTEVRRLELHGATSAEVGRALETVRAEHRAAAESAGARTSATLAQNLTEHAAEGDVLASPRERFRVLDKAADGLKEADVLAALKHDLSGAGPFVMVTTPAGAAQAEVKAAWRQAMTATPADVTPAATSSQWAYTDFGPAGKVVSREEIATPGFVRLRFANGVVLNYKKLTSAQDKVKVRIRFGAGRREIAKADYYAASLGAQLFLEGGLGKHDAETVRRLFSDHGWSAQMSILDDAFVLEGATDPGDIGSQMQILTAFLTDPGFRRGLDAKMPTTVEVMDREERSSPDFAISQALNRRVAPDGVYLVPPKDQLLAIRAETFKRILKPAMTEAPLEVTLVGDIGEEAAIEAVAKTVGALPPRPETRRVRPDTWFMRYPPDPLETVRTTYEGTEQKAVVSMVWPLYVAEPKRRREEYALNVLSNVLDDAIRHRVREEMGKAYAPQVSMSSPDLADQGSMSAYIETTAADAEAVAAAARQTAAEIAAHGVSNEAFQAALKPNLDAGATRLEDIDWWLGGLDGSAGNPEILREFVDWDADFHSIRLEDVNRYARVWLSNTPIVIIATPRSTVAASGSGSGDTAGLK